MSVCKYFHADNSCFGLKGAPLVDCHGDIGRCEIPDLKQKMTNPKPNMVDHPPHYTAGGIECIDALAAATTGLEGIEAVCTANAIKYLWRWKYKNGEQDLDKAIWYINRLKTELGKSSKLQEKKN